MHSKRQAKPGGKYLHHANKRLWYALFAHLFSESTMDKALPLATSARQLHLARPDHARTRYPYILRFARASYRGSLDQVVSSPVALALLRVVRVCGALPRCNSCAKQVARRPDAARNDCPQAPNAGEDANAMISSDTTPAALFAQATRMAPETERDEYTKAKGNATRMNFKKSLEGCRHVYTSINRQHVFTSINHPPGTKTLNSM